jgi:hypothetical protein
MYLASLHRDRSPWAQSDDQLVTNGRAYCAEALQMHAKGIDPPAGISQNIAAQRLSPENMRKEELTMNAALTVLCPNDATIG